MTNPLTQNLCTYCGNNPLNLIDPSGNWSIKGALKKFGKSVGNFVEKNAGTIVGVATGIVTGVAVTLATGNPVLGAAIGGAVGSGLSTALNDGSVKDVLISIGAGFIGGAVGGYVWKALGGAAGGIYSAMGAGISGSVSYGAYSDFSHTYYDTGSAVKATINALDIPRRLEDAVNGEILGIATYGIIKIGSNIKNGKLNTIQAKAENATKQNEINKKYCDDTTSKIGEQITEPPVKVPVIEGTGKTGWSMKEGGEIINGREYSQHALERMAPDTSQVRAELEARATQNALGKGLNPGTNQYNDFITKYVDPRGITPSVIEDAIQNGTKVAGKTPYTWECATSDVNVIINEFGDVITVMPK